MQRWLELLLLVSMIVEGLGSRRLWPVWEATGTSSSEMFCCPGSFLRWAVGTNLNFDLVHPLNYNFFHWGPFLYKTSLDQGEINQIKNVFMPNLITKNETVMPYRFCDYCHVYNEPGVKSICFYRKGYLTTTSITCVY